MRILIVDDERIVSDFFAQVARVRGVSEVDAVSSGEEALTQVIRTEYDLITLDIQMPGVSGLEIIAMLRNMCPHAIIALISGYIPDQISDDVAGCADVIIAKPVSVETFSRLLEGVDLIRQAREQIRTLGLAPDACR